MFGQVLLEREKCLRLLLRLALRFAAEDQQVAHIVAVVLEIFLVARLREELLAEACVRLVDIDYVAVCADGVDAHAVAAHQAA